MRRVPLLLLLCWSFPSLAQDASVDPDASVGDADVADAACNEVDALGQCQGDVMRSCVAGRLTEVRCSVQFGPGFTCRLSEGLGAAQCEYVELDAGTDLDAGREDAGIIGIGPVKEEEGGCVKLTPGNIGLVSSVGMVLMGRRRRKPHNT